LTFYKKYDIILLEKMKERITPMYYVSIKNPEAGIDVAGAFSDKACAYAWYARQIAMDPISKTTLYDSDKNILAENGG
jgi:hypothetical protein